MTEQDKSITEQIAEFAEFKSKPTTGKVDYQRIALLDSMIEDAEKLKKNCSKEIDKAVKAVHRERKNWHKKIAKILGMEEPKEKKED
jgi:hypothetical protein